MLTRALLEKNEPSRTEPLSVPQQVPLLLIWDHEPKISVCRSSCCAGSIHWAAEQPNEG